MNFITMIDILTQALRGDISQYHRSNPIIYKDVIEATSWMSVASGPLERAYCIVHNLTSLPTCGVCGANTKWIATKKQYSVTCGSKSCRYASSSAANKTLQSQMSDADKQVIAAAAKATLVAKHGSYDAYLDDIKHQREATMMERYGVQHTASSKVLRQKMVNTNIDRYGIDNVLKIDFFRAKANATNIERYGVEWHQQSTEGKAIRAETNTKLYGGPTPFASDDVQQQARATKLNRYGTDVTAHINPDKRKATLLERYGVKNYQQAHIPHTTLDLLNDRNWLIDQHHNQQKTLVAIASELNVDPKTVGERLKLFNIEAKRFGSSMGERELVEFIQSQGIEVQTRNRSLINPYELDVVIPEFKIAIEYCGLYWHSDIHPRMDSKYHARKVDLCAAIGYRLITIFEDEWQHKQAIVKTKLKNLLHINDSPVVHARKCTIQPVGDQLHQFYQQYHIQGYGRGSIKYGLFHEGHLVAAMSFIHHGDKTYELNRYATSGRVVGGFSKLLAHFKRTQAWTTIISYADRRWSDGNVYDVAGFTNCGVTKPSYWYLSSDKSTRIHRSHFRRIHLPNMLEHFDPTASEFANCDAHGVLRVWDCGLIRYQMTNLNQ